MSDTLELAPVEPSSALALVVNPLDMPVEAFRAGLDRRKANRAALLDWIRSAMVEGTDYGSIQTKRGMSKPSLWKPGAEKICGMLGVTPTFPTLKEYEDAALKGIDVKSIILRCEILNSANVIIAVGVGARSMEQDYGDLNKALKMAEKSAHIDATLRMAGLSELFTQDIEDMPQKADIKPPQQGTNFGKVSSKPPKPPPPTESPAERKTRFLKLFTGMERAATLVFMDHEFLIPEVDEDFSDIDDSHIPRTKKIVDLLVAEVKAKHLELSGGEAEQQEVESTELTDASTPDPDLPEQPDVSGCEQTRGKIMAVTVKEGESDHGAWKRFGIKIDEEWYSTFDHKLGHFAQTLKGRLVVAYYNKGQRGNDLLWLK